MRLVAWTQNQKVAWSYTLGAGRYFIARNLPAYVAVPHFLRRDAVCVYDGPWAQITFADKSYARCRLQQSIEPRHSVRSASSYFNLNDLHHSALSPGVKIPLPRLSVMVAGDPEHAC